MNMLTAPTNLAPIERVRAAQVAIMGSGQAVMPPVVHTFEPGVYIRGLPMQAGMMVIGRQHKTDHALQVISGTVLIDNGDGPVEVTGFATLHTEAGTKRAIYAVTDAYLQTIHVTTETDLEKLEHELLEPEPDLPRLELPR